LLICKEVIVKKGLSCIFFKYFFGVPHLATCIFLFFYNEPELGVGIDPGMALTPLWLCLRLEPILGNNQTSLKIVTTIKSGHK